MVALLAMLSAVSSQTPRQACAKKKQNAACYFMNQKNQKKTGTCKSGQCMPSASGQQQQQQWNKDSEKQQWGNKESEKQQSGNKGTANQQSGNKDQGKVQGAGGQDWMENKKPAGAQGPGTGKSPGQGQGQGQGQTSCAKLPCAAPTLGDVALTTVSGTDPGSGEQFSQGENIYGPFEAGFSAQQNGILEGLGCADGNDGHVAGG